ncbi:MAG: hypothetical protein KC933_38750, partial [Myxococcales bacterium]|nr:hypothetical protein [Myxococcales bacterium]
GVRHHSPACARNLSALLEAVKPRFVLVEGPEELTPLTPWMVHPETEAPFAAYCAWAKGTARHAAYYPFADYSPELVAVRWAAGAGAEARFVDLTFPELCKADRTEAPRAAARLTSLLREVHLSRSAYLHALARKTGCRDHDELWDHLFEDVGPLDHDTFTERVAVYCLMARLDHPQDLLEADGSLARERRMAAHVARVMDDGPVVVVTGGFHTPSLVELLSARRPPSLPKVPAAEAPVLLRYGFEQLDALNGYSSGMPSPAFYDALWRASTRGEADAGQVAAAETLVEVASLARSAGEPSVQAADEVAALTQATRLAELRGRQSVARRDLMDAALSTLCKGSAEVEGQAVQAILRSALCGRRVGQVPKEAGVPPIVRDFKARSEALKVSTGPVAREVALSLYQRAPHREASRFLHALRFLEVPYATWLAGPRYEAGEGLERRQETWRLRWTPDVERALVERSVYGPTVAEAAAARLEEAVAALGEAGHAQDAEAAVRLLVVAFVMGAFQVAQDLLPKVEAALATDARLERVVAALTVLVLSLEGREPLEVGAAAEAVRRQAHVAYHRACQLVQQVAVAPEARVEAVVTALQSLRQLAATEAAGLEVGKLAFAVGAALAGPRGSPKVEGALAGLAFGLGAEDAEALARRVRGHLLGTGRDTAGKVAFLFGVMATAREVAWRVPAVVEGLSSLFVEWPEAEFLAALPEL